MVTSHHILPVFMHHFGCVVPSFESLEIIKQVAKGKELLDIGSGNGYWAYMLRRHGMTVQAIDNLQSNWRTLWIGDTIRQDGTRFLKERNGCKQSILLLVYPVVGGEFTKRILEAYGGDTIIVAGTQNRNGYTAFKDVIIDDWIGNERKEYKKLVKVALPSFAGKDDGLFVFQKRSSI